MFAAVMELHSAPTASSAVRQPYKPVNTSDNAHKLLMAMHDKRSPARAALNLPATAYPGDFGAACARLIGWHVDEHGVAQQSPANNLQIQLLLCRQQLAAAQGQHQQKDLLLSGASVTIGKLQRDGESTATGLRAAQEALEAAQQQATRAEEARAAIERSAEAARRKASESLAALEARLREPPRARPERAQPASCGGTQPGRCSRPCCSPFEPRRRPAACDGCCEEASEQPPSPSVAMAELQAKAAAAAEKAAAAESEAATTQAQLKRARSALSKREREHDHIGTEQLYDAFANKENGEARASASAAERAAQRAVQRAVDALPADDAQAGVVLDAVLKRRREAAALADIRTCGDRTLSDEAMGRAREACATIMQKKGALSCHDATALDTFLTFIAPEKDEDAMQRGKQAKAALEAGEEVPSASVTHVREWARLLGMSPSTTWRHLKAAVEARSKLDDLEQRAYWLQTKARKGHGHSIELVEMVHKFYIEHPSIKRSPIANDVLWIKTGPGKDDRERVSKLLSEVSLTDVYMDFKKAYPLTLIGERSFRALRPLELRRMKTRHLDMCGCRCDGARTATRTPHLAAHRPAQCAMGALNVCSVPVRSHLHSRCPQVVHRDAARAGGAQQGAAAACRPWQRLHAAGCARKAVDGCVLCAVPSRYRRQRRVSGLRPASVRPVAPIGACFVRVRLDGGP